MRTKTTLSALALTLSLTGSAQVSPKLTSEFANPVIDHLFTADPTAVEHEGRLYVYGTNDHEQYEKADSNTYEKIKTLAMMSTDDMVNWTYHGLIPVGEIAPWIINSWAPSVISRKEEDGQTHFYLYFSNSGYGTGVLTATSPVGPWTSPLDRSLVDAHTPGLGDCNVPFDPGAVIDEHGTGWIAFGAGRSRIAQLGPDLISFASPFMNTPAQHHFDANELNYIGGKYVYTYNIDWQDHSDWTLSSEIPTRCCMGYMTTTTPLDSASWRYGNNYLKNPGDFPYFGDSNNHTHLHKYQGKWYLLYHTDMLPKALDIKGGFRSICVEEVQVDEDAAHIEPCVATQRGVSQTHPLNPYTKQQAATAAATTGVHFVEGDEPGKMLAAVGTPFIKESIAAQQSVIRVRGVDFKKHSKSFTATLKGAGTLSVYIDTLNGPAVAVVDATSDDWTAYTKKCRVSEKHDVLFVLTGDILFDSWQFK